MQRKCFKKSEFENGGLQEPVSSLSGGNAQKVVIGKWLMRSPQLMLLDDPTKGVDVGTKAEFYSLLTSLCDEGKTILFYSSDDEELVGLCDRVLVLYDGLIRTELKDTTLNQRESCVSQPGCGQRGDGMKKTTWNMLMARHPALFALILFVIIIIINAILQPNLFALETLNNNMRVFLPLLLLAVGQTIVMIGGGIDISVGGIVSIINCVLATQVGLNGSWKPCGNSSLFLYWLVYWQVQLMVFSLLFYGSADYYHLCNRIYLCWFCLVSLTKPGWRYSTCGGRFLSNDYSFWIATGIFCDCRNSTHLVVRPINAFRSLFICGWWQSRCCLSDRRTG